MPRPDTRGAKDAVCPSYYLTTAIDYSNGDPHLGHALEKVGADCIARYRRLRGDAVHFLMGMDEHCPSGGPGRRAERAPTPQAWVDRMAERFERLLAAGSSAATTTGSGPPSRGTALRSPSCCARIRERHPDDLFVGEYEGLYCVGCEEFKQRSADRQRPLHRASDARDLVPTKERNHFFRLSRYRDRCSS